MNDSIFLDTFVALNNILDETKCLYFWERSIILDVLQQISSLTKLSDDVHIVLCHEDFNSLKDVWMLQKL